MHDNCLFGDSSNIKTGISPLSFKESEYIPYFKSFYQSKILKDLMECKGYRNPLMVPYVSKIVVSSALSTTKQGGDKNILKKIFNTLYLMTGVMPTFTRSSVSISQFKLQKDSIIGCKAILRKNFIYEFLERLVFIYLPNVKGFLGIPESSVSHNTLNIGIKDIHVVREVTTYLGLIQFGCTITICVNNVKTSEDTIDLLKRFDIPIKKEL